MKKLLVSAAGAATLLGLFSSTAMAQDKPISLGLRAGYGIPMGKVQDDVTVAGQTTEFKLSDTVSSAFPALQLDAGYFVTPEIMLGAYFGYAVLSVADDACPSGVDCSANQLRYGIQAQYHLSRGENLDPWFGLGFGFEDISMSREAGGQSQDFSLSGLEFISLNGGADFQVADGIGVGPYVSFALGQYSKTTDSAGKDADIEETAMHQWLTLGVKGSFGF
ncbi:MAG: outer membrane beta-barrel protein [Polyangiaceae bacterium]|nr:outer membrane beta-barrel protein [Polyangiaceae bacterium]